MNMASKPTALRMDSTSNPLVFLASSVDTKLCSKKLDSEC